MQTINDYIEDLKAYCEDMDDFDSLDHETYCGVLCALRTAVRHCKEVYVTHESLRRAAEHRERERVRLVMEKRVEDKLKMP